MWDTAGEVGTSSLVIYSCGHLHMDEQRQDNQLEPTHSSPEDQPEVMDDRKGWQERVRDICAGGTT